MPFMSCNVLDSGVTQHQENVTLLPGLRPETRGTLGEDGGEL